MHVWTGLWYTYMLLHKWWVFGVSEYVNLCSSLVLIFPCIKMRYGNNSQHNRADFALKQISNCLVVRAICL
jgi:hypothetical protein